MDVELGPGARNGLDKSCPLMHIMYRDLTVTVKVTRKEGKKKITQERQLLKGITGMIAPARLTAGEATPLDAAPALVDPLADS
jgi:hypothetical protein